MDDVEADLTDPDGVATALYLALRLVEDIRLSSTPNQPFPAMGMAFVAAFHRELVARLDVHELGT